MQALLGNLQRLLDRSEILQRIKSRNAPGELPSPSEQPQWNENVIAFVTAFRGARDVRGCVVGSHLNRLAAHLVEQNGQLISNATDGNVEPTHGRAVSLPQIGNRSLKAMKSRSAKPAASNARESFLRPILDEKGFSVHDWARTAGVDFHTANDYLYGRTRPYKSTRKKLADAIGLGVEKLPA
jgi:hypothetical protein